jgi:predicted Ser/Thr protein kinase
MTADEYRRVRDLFEQALELEPNEAMAWLEAQSEEPASVVAEVRALLAHHSRAGDFLVAPATRHMEALAEASPAHLPGTRLGSYVIERELAQGGMGCVYLATDERLGRKVALKTLPAAMTRGAAQRERLRREARAAASLTHPGICTVYAFEEVDDEVCIATEYIDGHTLRDEMKGGLPDLATLRATTIALAEAVASAHDRGITHRDLKPENVMRSASGVLKVLDFGLALTSGDEQTAPMTRMTVPGAFVGTPGYMSPEQLAGGAVDARSDVFALGILLYEYASGQHPFEAVNPLVQAARILEANPTPVEVLRPDIPSEMAALISRALQKDPHHRFPHARAMVDALSRDSRPADVDAASTPQGVATWWRIHQLVTIGMYAVAGMLAWLVREWVHGAADPLFFVVGILATVAGVFRGHLLFTERVNRALFARELRRAAPVTLGIDVTLGLILLIEGMMLTGAHAVPAVLTMALGAGIVLARVLLERSTTRAAFGE